jgi:hypothetical protein
VILELFIIDSPEINQGRNPLARYHAGGRLKLASNSVGEVVAVPTLPTTMPAA